MKCDASPAWIPSPVSRARKGSGVDNSEVSTLFAASRCSGVDLNDRQSPNNLRCGAAGVTSSPAGRTAASPFVPPLKSEHLMSPNFSPGNNPRATKVFPSGFSDKTAAILRFRFSFGNRKCSADWDSYWKVFLPVGPAPPA